MKTVVIICAMDKELASIRELFHAHVLDSKKGIIEAIGEKHRVLAAVCGIGKVNAAAFTQYCIDRFTPDYIINCGIAGGLDKSLKPLDIVVGREAMYHDFRPLSFLKEDPNIGCEVFPCDAKLAEHAARICGEMKEKGEVRHFVTGRILSGDCLVDTTELSDRLRNELNGACVEMEGAAIAQVCLINRVPFLILRSISDFADDDFMKDYEKMCCIAADRAGKVLHGIISALEP